MKILRNLAVAFSLYSRIPMPIFEWKEEDTKHNLVFLPGVGVVIGALILLAWKIMGSLDAAISVFFNMAVFTVIPLLITGGFHLDGFLDVQDALKSYKSKEEKLDILKDPHIGAFAVIRLLIFGLIWMASMNLLCYSDEEWIFPYAISFALVRAVAALTSIRFQHARKDGMLNMETKDLERKDQIALLIEIFLFAGLMLVFQFVQGLILIVGLLLYTLVYKKKCYKEFGGVTGDTTGYFIVNGEGVILVLMALLRLIG